MLPYIICFVSSGLLCFVGEYVLKKSNSKPFAITLFAFAVLIPSILAGVRNFNIGTDISFYGNRVFGYACQNRDLASLILGQIKSTEPLYIVLNYFVATFTNNVHWLYFAIGLIIYGFFMAGIFCWRDKISITLAWLAFLGIFLGDTLNLMRQFLAMGILFWGFHFMPKKKYGYYLICNAAAILFHYTAVLGLLVLLIYVVLKKWPKYWLILVMAAVVLLSMVLFRPLLTLLLAHRVLPQKYQLYLRNSFPHAPTPIRSNLLSCVFWLPGLLIAYFKREQFSKFEDSENASGIFLIAMMTLDIVTFQYRRIVYYLYRFSFFFGIFKPVAYGRIIEISDNKKQKMILTGLFIILVIINFYVRTVLLHENQIYPFESDIMNQLLNPASFAK